MNETLITGIFAGLFALVHVLGSWLRFLHVTPRSFWLSLAGGVALAYVFVHLLPELAAKQEESLDHLGAEDSQPIGLHAYITALAGLLVFYGLDRLVRSRSSNRHHSSRDHGRAPASVFWLHLASYAIYNLLVGYLLLHREDHEITGLAIYAVALGLHFIVNDQALREYHGRSYDRWGRWLLAAAPLVGWLLGQVIDLTPVAVATIFAFLAGGIVLNVLKEELPEERESRFWALAAGALLFSAVLVWAR